MALLALTAAFVVVGWIFLLAYIGARWVLKDPRVAIWWRTWVLNPAQDDAWDE